MDKLEEGLKRLSIDCSTEQMQALRTYIESVLDFNKSYNLMKAESPDDMAINHILDSLAAVPHIKELLGSSQTQKMTEEPIQIGDIGSGGGCPGIPLSIILTDCSFTLVERMEKRCAFLEAAVSDIAKITGKRNARVLCSKANEVPKESFNIEVFRAFHPFDKDISRLLLGLLKKGGYIVAYKAREQKIKEEMDGVKQIIPQYKKIHLSVPFLEDHERNLVIVQK